jgi:phosphoglycerate dehydrogenase-like enzyme
MVEISKVPWCDPPVPNDRIPMHQSIGHGFSYTTERTTCGNGTAMERSARSGSQWYRIVLAEFREAAPEVNMTNPIAVLDDYQQVAAGCADWSAIPDADVTFFSDHLSNLDALAERLRPFEIIGIMRERTPFPAELLRRLPSLRLLITTGRRNAAIDVDAATELGITVCGTPSQGHATAELAFGLILDLARGLTQQVLSVRGGGWQRGLGRDLRGAMLGLLGLGRLGSQVAGFGLAFGMEVCAWSENLTSGRAAEVGVRAVSKRELFASSDFISIHLQLSDRTVGLVGSKELALMKPDAYLVNTSRAAIVDEDTLTKALQEGRIAGAALDVFGEEPLPIGHRLRNMPGVLTTPHIGYVTRETYQIFFHGMVDAIVAFLEGTPILVIV